MKNLTILLILCCLPATVQCAASDPIVTEGVVNAAIEQIWKFWTTKDGIESWMVAKTEIDLKIGGLWRTSYSKESNLNDDAAIHQSILAFDPGRMLAFRTVKVPKGFPFPNAMARAWTVVYLEPVNDSRTKVTIRMLGYTDDEESQKMKSFFERGNRTTLDALMKKFQ